MLFIAGKPILRYVVEALAQNGIRDIVIVVGYRREQIFDYIGSGEEFGVDITYITQEKQLGTAHALAQAREAVEKGFLVVSGDKLIDASTIARFVAAEPESVLVKKIKDADPTRYGVLTISEGMVKDILERPIEVAGDVGHIVSTRIYALSREIFDFIESGLMISDGLKGMIAGGKHVYAHETDGPWLDVVYPWDILGLNDIVIRQAEASVAGTIEHGVSLRGLVSVGEGTVVRSSSCLAGPVVIGANCDIGPNVCISPATSIGDNVVISPFTEVKNSVLGSDISIGSGCIIQDSVIGGGCIIGGQFSTCAGEADVKVDAEYHSVKVGAMLGENCNIGSNVVAQPGVIVGNNCKVQSLKLISGRLPDGSSVL